MLDQFGRKIRSQNIYRLQFVEADVESQVQKVDFTCPTCHVVYELHIQQENRCTGLLEPSLLVSLALLHKYGKIADGLVNVTRAMEELVRGEVFLVCPRLSHNVN